MSHWSGLARRSPLLAAVFTLYLRDYAERPLTPSYVTEQQHPVERLHPQA